MRREHTFKTKVCNQNSPSLFLFLIVSLILCLRGKPSDLRIWSLEDLEKEMATHPSILAWRIPWTEEPGVLQSMWSQRAGHDWATQHTQHTHLVILIPSQLRKLPANRGYLRSRLWHGALHWFIPSPIALLLTGASPSGMYEEISLPSHSLLP